MLETNQFWVAAAIDTEAALEIAKQGSDAITRIEDMAVHASVAIVRDRVPSCLFEDGDLMKSASSVVSSPADDGRTSPQFLYTI